MKRWISLHAELGKFQHRRTVYVFALKMSFLAVILSGFAIAAMLPTLDFIGFLPLPLAHAIQFGVVLSWLVCGLVSGVLALLAGHALHELAVSRAEFEKLSRTDMLSGLLNRRAFTEALDATENGASLVIFDVDRFKSINDRYGHACGDAVIVAVSLILADTFGGSHTVARLGGEEFGVIVRGGSIQDRIARIEKVRAAIGARAVHAGGSEVAITISAGIADIWTGTGKDAVYAAADKALYLAKALGRNRVVHESEGLKHIRAMQGEDRAGAADELLEVDPRYGFGGI
ncbi:GGDEF domain-containing protein [Rhizobium sp. BK251]|uniref:GGDEF domain-containing protein n=1 Tax=Rhizobium sp. BK251 TaxID=2512125 RepID=UPI00104D8A1D|nr:GGDEF domain-containing protein [Rhizobium sp. BK251]TCL74496.1 diguanylate cyclase (GGDEF)-like protein [Rhizobium sp. BK251]